MEAETIRLCFYQLLITSYVIAALLAGWKLGKYKTTIEKLIIAWLIFDALVHITLEGSYVYLSIGGTVETSTSILSYMWKDFGATDKRYLVADPVILSMELPTVLVGGPLAIILIYAIVTNKYYRHPVQITLCVLELYGDWMTFAPEYIAGADNLNSDNVIMFWGNLVFMNAVWVVIPILLLINSWNELREMHSAKYLGQKSKPSSFQSPYSLRSKKHT